MRFCLIGITLLALAFLAPRYVVGAQDAIATDARIAGRVVEVKEGGDVPARTLAELQLHTVIGADGQPQLGEGAALIWLFTASDGTFSYREVPPGTHVLWVWGGLGFEGDQTHVRNTGLFLAEVTVDESGAVFGPIPPVFRIREKPSGTLGYPLRNGFDLTKAYDGSVSVREAVAARGPIGLPSTGSGAREATLPVIALIASAVMLVGAGVSFRALRRG